MIDTFWYLANERYAMYENRLTAGVPVPSTDPILANHRFTNTFRASDRVSQRLIKLQYDGPQGLRATVLRTLLFKLFNKEETWDLLVGQLGEPQPDNYAAYLEQANRVLSDAQGTIFNGAYIMANSIMGGQAKHTFYLSMLADMLSDESMAAFANAGSLLDLYKHLLSFDGIGPFLAYQYAIDLNYSDEFVFAEKEFVQAGPGALRGLAKLFGDSRMASDKIYQLYANNERGPKLLGQRPMQPIDVQNVLCEFDKYTRVSHPDLGAPGKRIKQRFTPSPAPLPEPFFPPKWGLN